MLGRDINLGIFLLACVLTVQAAGGEMTGLTSPRILIIEDSGDDFSHLRAENYGVILGQMGYPEITFREINATGSLTDFDLVILTPAYAGWDEVNITSKLLTYLNEGGAVIDELQIRYHPSVFDLGYPGDINNVNGVEIINNTGYVTHGFEGLGYDNIAGMDFEGEISKKPLFAQSSHHPVYYYKADYNPDSGAILAFLRFNDSQETDFGKAVIGYKRFLNNGIGIWSGVVFPLHSHWSRNFQKRLIVYALSHGESHRIAFVDGRFCGRSVFWVREDDVQAWTDYIKRPCEFQKRVIEAADKHGVRLTQFVCPNKTDPGTGKRHPIYTNERMVDLLKSNYPNHGIEMHGLIHYPLEGYPLEFFSAEFSNYSRPGALPYDIQHSKIRASRDLLQRYLGVTPTGFVPPANAYDTNTTLALRNEGLLWLSGSPYSGHIYPNYDPLYWTHHEPTRNYVLTLMPLFQGIDSVLPAGEMDLMIEKAKRRYGVAIETGNPSVGQFIHLGSVDLTALEHVFDYVINEKRCVPMTMGDFADFWLHQNVTLSYKEVDDNSLIVTIHPLNKTLGGVTISVPLNGRHIHNISGSTFWFEDEYDAYVVVPAISDDLHLNIEFSSEGGKPLFDFHKALINGVSADGVYLHPDSGNETVFYAFEASNRTLNLELGNTRLLPKEVIDEKGNVVETLDLTVNKGWMIILEREETVMPAAEEETGIWDDSDFRETLILVSLTFILLFLVLRGK